MKNLTQGRKDAAVKTWTIVVKKLKAGIEHDGREYSHELGVPGFCFSAKRSQDCVVRYTVSCTYCDLCQEVHGLPVCGSTVRGHHVYKAIELARRGHLKTALFHAEIVLEQVKRSTVDPGAEAHDLACADEDAQARLETTQGWK